MANETLGTIQILGLIDANPVDGSEFLVISQGVAARKVTILNAIKPHTDNTNNPHKVTKTQVGLGNVTNDAQLKIASNLSDVADKVASRNNLEVYSKGESDSNLKQHTDDTNNPHKVDKNQVGLGLVPNKAASDAFRTVSDTLATTKAVNDLFKAIQDQNPVGDVHVSMNPANPSTYLLCGGVWELISKGAALVGFDSGRSDRPVGTSFGSSTKNITEGNLPAHGHGVNITSQPHAHGVVGNTMGAGGHYHNFSGSTSYFDYGVKSGATDGQGNHQHHGYTGAGGNHRHMYAGDDQLNVVAEVAQDRIGRYDADSDTDNWARNYWTSYSGDHSHEFWTEWAGLHAHNFSVAIGGHSHDFSGVTNSVADHGHGINFASQTSTVSVVGATATTGGNQPLNVEQPSLVVYIWRRTA